MKNAADDKHQDFKIQISKSAKCLRKCERKTV